jgi:hypothetical protein
MPPSEHPVVKTTLLIAAANECRAPGGRQEAEPLPILVRMFDIMTVNLNVSRTHTPE